MPFVLIILGLLFLVVAINGTHHQFFSLLQSEFTGNKSFVVWVAAIVILGLIGFYRPLRPISQAMIGLVILVMILANKGGFFAQFNAALANPVAPATTATATPALAYAGAAPAGSSLAMQSGQINAGVPQVVDPSAVGYEVQPIPGL